MDVTETPGKYDHLEMMSLNEVLININNEDKTVSHAVEKAIPEIEALVHALVKQMKLGGRLFYIGAGTSGRLGIVDASECPPTFGVPYDLLVGLIAGGDTAIRKAVEFAEDDPMQAWKDLENFNISKEDFVIGIAASGKTPYVLGGLESCRNHNIYTGSISCNPDAPISKVANYPIEVIVGPEFVRGSTRMKAGTAQKLVLNMISTTTMIQLGHVKGNKMVDMQLTNNKLLARAALMLVEELNISIDEAKKLIKKYGNVKDVLNALK